MSVVRRFVFIALIFSLTLAACDQQTLNELQAALQTEEAAQLTQQADVNKEPVAVPSRTPRPATAAPPTRAASTSSGTSSNPSTQTWTVLLYQNADDEVLEQDIFIDFNEAERVGSTDRVKIVSQLDRFAGGFRGDGNWNSTRRYLITQDDDLYAIGSEPLAEGESNMADGDTLVDFIKWGVENYPADKYALIMSDHGMGWPGGWNDPTARGSGADDVPIAQAFGDLLYVNELDRSLERAIRETGIGQFELIGFDACLMSHIEVFAAVQPYARYSVASQEVEPGLGWAYSAFLGELVNNPGMDGRELSTVIVNSYIVGDQRILDEQARADYTGRRVNAEAVADATSANATLAAVDLAKIPDVLRALDDFAVAAGEADPRQVARARTYAQSFESIFGQEVPPSYIDMAHFAALTVQTTNDPAIADATKALLAAMGEAVIAETSGPERPGAYGISIYFPNSQLFRNALAGYESYTSVAQRFAADSLWDDFLVAHYTGRQLTRTVTLPTPVPDAEVVAPGAGALTLDPIRLSSQTSTLNNPATLSTVVRGDNLGFVYLFVGVYDQQRNALKFADQDFIEGDDTQNVNGVFYPVWNGTEVLIDFAWEPILFAIDDGTQTVQAALYPEDYGASAEAAVYSVEGFYVYGESGDRRYAKMFFDGASELRAIFGFTGADGQGAPREIVPQLGDSFILLDTWYDLGTQGYFTEEGATLTFGDVLPTWTQIDAPPGLYNVGFIAEDLDGNFSEQYVDVRVR
ncbi:MAG: clostripain-related cysteine peptidase [Anaerolineales bacterium]